MHGRQARHRTRPGRAAPSQLLLAAAVSALLLSQVQSQAQAQSLLQPLLVRSGLAGRVRRAGILALARVALAGPPCAACLATTPTGAEREEGQGSSVR